MKLIKKLTAIFVVVFCFMTALSVINVSADESTGGAYKEWYVNSSNSTSIQSYTSNFTTTINGDTWTTTNGNNNKLSWSYVKFGRKNNASVGSIATDFAIDKAVTFVTITIDSVTTSKINSIKLYVASDSTFQTNVQTASFEIAKGEQTAKVTNPAVNMYYKVEFDCASGSSNGLIQVSKVTYNTAALTVLTAPTVSASNNVVSWNKVENATKYVVSIFEENETVATTTIETEDTKWDLSKFVSLGTWYVKVKAIGDNVSYSDSEYSTDEVKFTNDDDAISCNATEFLSYIDPNKNVYFTLTGKVSVFYDSDNKIKVEENNYNSTYNNICFYISDGENEVLAFRVKGAYGATLKVGDDVTVCGKLGIFNNTNQIAAGGTYSNIISIGVQYTELDSDVKTRSIRLVGALNVDASTVESLSFTINNGDKEKNYGGEGEVDSLFTTLTSSHDGEITSVSTSDLGFTSLFALTITDVPVGVTLEVTAEYTDSNGTTSSSTIKIVIDTNGEVTVTK